MTVYLPQLNEIAERAIAEILPGNKDRVVITRGVMAVELLVQDNQNRGIVGVTLGQQGVIQPWEVVGLMAPVAMAAQADMAKSIWTGDDQIE